MKDEIRKIAIKNALEHDGRADFGAVMGRSMASFNELKKDPKGTASVVQEVVAEVNSRSLDELKELNEEIGDPKKLKKREKMDPMPDLVEEKEKVVMRFAPGPSGPLHIGHTRAAILNDEYVKRHGGKFILRLEDTNPEKIDPEAYRMIPEDLKWLGVEVGSTYLQSERMERYYKISMELIEREKAYVCTCDADHWRDLKNRKKPCPHRDTGADTNLELWERMLEGSFSEGEASLMIKTDIEHKNPAVRDFVGYRIKDAVHPNTGDRYHVYPLYNLSVAIDDHLMGCTHVLRGKDHLNNTYRQEYVYKHMGWDKPEFIHYGLVSIPDTVLKTSIIREQISEGKYTGWDDIRLGTLRGLASRGIKPESLREYWKGVGIKPVDITFSWENLFSINRSRIDASAIRLFFVEDPVEIRISSEGSLAGKAPLHPEYPEKGYREYSLDPDNGCIPVSVPSEELKELKKGDVLRLKDLCNVLVEDPETGSFRYLGKDVETLKESGGKIIQWVEKDGIDCEVILPDGGVHKGVAEKEAAKYARLESTVQFERVGYCKLYMDDGIKARFSHS